MSRELDAKVAENVLGFPRTSSNQLCPPGTKMPPHWHALACVSNFTTNASADYEVLKHVRETWDRHKQESFTGRLNDLWTARNKYPEAWMYEELDQNCPLFYEPGDFSKAALKALGEEVEVEERNTI
jgi:hypothetical protein